MNKEPIITVGRGLLVFYLILVAIGAMFLPGGDCSKHHLALRHLGQNTRIHQPLLTKPTGLSIEDHFWLDQELKQLEGKYLSREVEAGQPVTPQDVRPWPEIKREDAIPVEFESIPDWVSFNQGSFVQVWIESHPISERAYVLAIVPSGSRWLALLRRNDLSKLVSSKEPLKLRLDVVAGK